MDLLLPITQKPFLQWEGEDVIGHRARITGNKDEGFRFEYQDPEGERWLNANNVENLGWIVEGFLADCMKNQAALAQEGK